MYKHERLVLSGRPVEIKRGSLARLHCIIQSRPYLEALPQESLHLVCRFSFLVKSPFIYANIFLGSCWKKQRNLCSHVGMCICGCFTCVWQLRPNSPPPFSKDSIKCRYFTWFCSNVLHATMVPFAILVAW